VHSFTIYSTGSTTTSIAVWTLIPSPGEPAIRNGTSSGFSKNIPPLAEYIRAQKLQKSVERLAHSDEPILNVAIALGFDSQQSFNRSFKRQYGQAPGAWRRSIGCRGSRQMSQ
jgi:AraC-like DNA-binding protein